MAIGLPSFVSATPKGIMELLKRYEIETSGKTCVVLGRSNIVGKPMAQLMMQKKQRRFNCNCLPQSYQRHKIFFAVRQT